MFTAKFTQDDVIRQQEIISKVLNRIVIIAKQYLELKENITNTTAMVQYKSLKIWYV